jgi:acetyltransferase-like isoleucine patch superfamily enzyme
MIMIYEPVALDSSACLGVDTTIWTFATVEAHVVMGARCVVGSCAWVGRGTKMGDDVRIQHGAFLCRGSEIGHCVFIGPHVTLTDDKYPKAGNTDYTPNPPILEDGCSIGAGAVICPGVRIGKDATVGAGAVVVDDVRAGTIVVGIPARELDYAVGLP